MHFIQHFTSLTSLKVLEDQGVPDGLEAWSADGPAAYWTFLDTPLQQVNLCAWSFWWWFRRSLTSSHTRVQRSSHDFSLQLCVNDDVKSKMLNLPAALNMWRQQTLWKVVTVFYCSLEWHLLGIRMGPGISLRTNGPWMASPVSLLTAMNAVKVLLTPDWTLTATTSSFTFPFSVCSFISRERIRVRAANLWTINLHTRQEPSKHHLHVVYKQQWNASIIVFNMIT